MPQSTWRVELEDGRIFNVEVDGEEQPTDDEVQAFLASQPDETPAPVQPMASHGEQPPGSVFSRLMQGLGEGEMNQADASRQMPGVAGNMAIGAGKGGANTAIGLGGTVNWIAGSPVDPSVFASARREFATPTNDAQRIGFGIEQGAEFFALPQVKGGLLARMAGEGAQQGALSATQGHSPTPAAAAGAAAPILGSAGRAFGAMAPRLVRSAIKPTVSEMKHVAGASQTGINAQADRLVKFILDEKIATSAQAQAIIDGAEAEVQRLVSESSAVTDAPQRAMRYLQALERSAAKQGLPADDVASIRGKMAELLDTSPLGETVMTPVLKPSPSGLVDPAGKPILVASHEPSRQLRTDVGPAEALELARGGGRWGNRKAWGEQKGAARESSKAVERANRDAVKSAVPGTREALQREGRAIQARSVFDRMAFREANREPVSPFDVTTAAVEMAHGNVPVLSAGRAWLRENKLKAGIWAKRMEEALARNDAAEAATILARFGVGVGQGLRPVPSH